MCVGVGACIKAITCKIEDFLVKVCLHPGSSLNPCLFVIVMDELTHSIQEDAPWCMIFADDMVLMDTTNEGVGAGCNYGQVP